MLTGEEWLFRPVLAGMIRAESLEDGSASLSLIAACNDALDVQDENNRRAYPPGSR